MAATTKSDCDSRPGLGSDAPGRADAPVAAPPSPDSSEDLFETVFGTDGFESDEAPEVSAPVPRLRSGFSTASSAGVWGTWPVRAPPDCGDGSLEEEWAAAQELVVEEELAAADEVVVNEDLGAVLGSRRWSRAPAAERLRVS